MRSTRPRLQLLLGFTVALAAAPAQAQDDRFDPFEPANRKFFAVHQVIDRVFLSPVSHLYARVIPKPLRTGLRNFSRNLSEPLVFVNDVLQGHPRAAGRTLGRFTVNSTAGVGGLIDVATRTGLPHHDNDFGMTLGRWGAQPGPYLFIPLLGPSTLRDTVGGVVNIFLSPQYYADYPGRPIIGTTTLVVNGVEARLDAQQALDTIQQTSTDPYATLRSYFLQSREAAIHGANNPTALPDFDTPDIQSEPAPQGGDTQGGGAQGVPDLPTIESEPEPSATAQPATPSQPPPSQPAPSQPGAAEEPSPAQPAAAPTGVPAAAPEPVH